MKFIVKERNTLVKGKVFDFDQAVLELPDGHTTQYQYIRHPGGVAILPVDDQGNILFVEQYRLGSDSDLLELPAGTLGSGEDPLECARREIREETGFAAGQMHLLGSLYLAPGYSTEFMHIYLAEDLRPDPLPGDEDEIITLIRIPIREAYCMVSENKIKDAKTLAGLMLAHDKICDNMQ